MRCANGATHFVPYARASARRSPRIAPGSRAPRIAYGGGEERRVPAFRILTDRTLVGIASARPTDETELPAAPGIGPALLAQHGRLLLALAARPIA